MVEHNMTQTISLNSIPITEWENNIWEKLCSICMRGDVVTSTSTTVTPHLSRNSSKQYTQKHTLRSSTSLLRYIANFSFLFLSLRFTSQTATHCVQGGGGGWRVFDWSRTWRRSGLVEERDVFTVSVSQSGLLWSIQGGRRSQLYTGYSWQTTLTAERSSWQTAGENTTLLWQWNIIINLFCSAL